MPESMSFDRVADEYDRMRGGLQRGRQSAAGVLPHLAPGLVLDVGVGTGVVAAGLRELGVAVVGVDLSPAMLERARQRLGAAVACADGGALPVASASVGNVVFVHVLHLVGDMGAAVAEAARVLRPGGRLVAVHGSPAADPDDLVDALARLDHLQPRRPDTPEGLVRAGAAAGLRLVGQERSAEYERGSTPGELADSIVARVPPFLWNLDQATWRDQVEPVIATLRTLPDQARPRQQVWRSRCTVMARD